MLWLSLEDYDNAVAKAKAIRDKAIVEVLALYDKAIALAEAAYNKDWVQFCNDVNGWHDYHHACALAKAVYELEVMRRLIRMNKCFHGM